MKGGEESVFKRRGRDVVKGEQAKNEALFVNVMPFFPLSNKEQSRKVLEGEGGPDLSESNTFWYGNPGL